MSIKIKNKGVRKEYIQSTRKMGKFALLLTTATLLLVMLSSCYFGKYTGDKARIGYNTVEELQKMWPDYYYFPFGDEVELLGAGVDSVENRKTPKWENSMYDYNYYCYTIRYKVKSITSGTSDLEMQVSADKRSHAIDNIDLISSGYTVLEHFSREIGGVVCKFHYLNKITKEMYSSKIDRNEFLFNISIVLDKVVYTIQMQEVFTAKFNPYDASLPRVTIEQYLSIVEPAIINKHRGG